jgi:hypothetical protein
MGSIGPPCYAVCSVSMRFGRSGGARGQGGAVPPGALAGKDGAPSTPRTAPPPPPVVRVGDAGRQKIYVHVFCRSG